MPRHPMSDRAAGTLHGLALGDALGMPSQTLTRTEIAARYGEIADFVDPFPDHPVSHGLRAGQVTDDTEQALLLARRLIRAPDRFDAVGWAHDLLDWEAGIRRRGLRDLLGPSTKAALEAIGRGADPGEAGRSGTTNGAAMRIAPLGIATPATNLSRLVDAVEAVSRVTHNTGEAIAGASAVAAAISAQIDGATREDALARALDAAALGQGRGHAAGVPDMAPRIARALDLARSSVALPAFAEATGTSVASHASVPAAFGLVVMAGGDAWRACCLAANIGDDTDTIGAIAGAICGAGAGRSGLPAEALATLESVNDLPIEEIAAGLLALRTRAAAPQEAAP